VPLAVAPLVTPVPGTVPRLVIVPTDSSGVQSIWTGLFEFSFALPVDLSASLPAFGCALPELPASSELQSGFDAGAAVVAGAAAVVVAFVCCVRVVVVVCANAGTASAAASAIALMNWERIISFLLLLEKPSQQSWARGGVC